MIANLWLLFLVFVKVGVWCGLAEFAFFYAVVYAWRARRVPARHRVRFVVSSPRAKRLWVGTHPIGAKFGDASWRKSA